MEKIKINLSGYSKRSLENLMILRLHNSSVLQRNGNSAKFADIIGGKVVVISSLNNRVTKELNPHLKDALIDCGCDNWRIDNLNWCVWGDTKCFWEFRNVLSYARELEINLKTKAVERIINPNEKLCRTCGALLDANNEKIGDFCECCFMEESKQGRFYGYHRFIDAYKVLDKNANKLDYNKTLTFGCEIERDYVGINDCEEERKKALFNACKILYKDLKKDTKQKAVFMHDGSLCCGGVEWITFPATEKYYKKHKQEFKKMIESFENHNFTDTPQAGNHIHINRSFFGNSSKYGACKMALIVSIFWDELVAIANRECLSYTRNIDLKRNEDIYNIIEKSIKNQYEHSVAVNQEHTNTIELRLWGAIKSVEDLLLFINLTKAIAKTAKRLKIETIQKMSFIDLLKRVDKEYLSEIKERLNNKFITRYNAKIDQLKGEQ